MSSTASRILLVIPAFRESRRLPNFLEKLCEAINGSTSVSESVEIQVVDDGSGSEEQAFLVGLLEELRPRFSFLLEPILLEENRGKGGAVYAGWDSSQENGHERLAFVDADGAVSPTEIVRLLSNIDTMAPNPKSDALFAIRVRGTDNAVRRTLGRKLLGQVFRLIVRILFWLPCRDTQCGFKIIPSDRFRELRPDLVEYRFCFDVELAWRLHHADCRICEEPISWSETPGSQMRPLGAMQMPLSLLKLRWRLR